MSKAVQPLVSVIMPAYNAEAHIADSIRSVLGQTYAGWELIVVDDGSTDRTAEVVRRFAAADPRVTYVFQENGRQGKARNNGIRRSRGPLVAFLDADDLWLEEKLGRQVRVIEEQRADLVFCNGLLFRDGEEPDGETFSVVCGRYSGPEMLRLLLLSNRIPTLSVLARRAALDAVGLFTEEPQYQNCEDYDLWIRLAERGAVFYGMEEMLVRYRRHPASATHRESNALRPMVAVVRRHVGGVLDKREKRERLRGLYRALIAALVEEGSFEEARERMKEFHACDRGGLVTAAQRALMAVLPGQFNFVSRELLYRTEWHLKRIFGAERRRPVQ